MRHHLKALTGVLLLAGLLFAVAPSVGASHGGSKSRELALLGRLDIAAGPGHISDVWAHGTYAYLGSFDEPLCSLDFTGVHIVDISDPSRPVKVGFIPSPPNARANDVKVGHISTRFFQGDVLVHSNEPCGGRFHPRAVADDAAQRQVPSDDEARNGIAIYDVTDPLKPRQLRQNFLPFPVHNTFIHQAGDRALLLVVSDERFIGSGDRDFYIVDISRPSDPRVLSRTGSPDWGIDDELLGDFAISGLHDVWAATYPAEHPNPAFAGRTIAYLSYWDSGLVLLDITDPSNPVFLGDSNYLDPDPLSGFPPEGNAHVAVPTQDGSLVFLGDEDFSPFRATFTVDSGPFAGEYRAVEGAFTKPIASLPDRAMNGPTTFVGRACTGGAPVPAPTGSPGPDEEFVAVIERGDCRFDEKITNVAAAGYGGAVVFNRVDVPDELVLMGGDPALGVIPAVFVTRFTGFAILAIDPASPAATPLPPIGTPGERMTARVTFDGWGYGRILDVSNPASIVELGQFATENVLAEPVPPGDHTMHNVVVDGRRAYISWYADGIRVVDFKNPKQPREVAHSQPAGASFWGVYLHPLGGQKLILGSDRNLGLWIFAAP